MVQVGEMREAGASGGPGRESGRRAPAPTGHALDHAMIAFTESVVDEAALVRGGRRSRLGTCHNATLVNGVRVMERAWEVAA